MPPIPRPRRPARPGRLARTSRVRIVVLGDLMLDVVLAPASALRSGTDVPGRVSLVQGGSAATTARWLGRLGARSTLIAAVGRDATGRALVDAVRADHVTPHVTRVAGARTGRIGVLVAPGGGRAFVAGRGAADPRPPVRGAGGARPGGIGVLAARGGGRPFGAARGAAALTPPDALRRPWCAGGDAAPRPVSPLRGQPLGLAGRRAVELARA